MAEAAVYSGEIQPPRSLPWKQPRDHETHRWPLRPDLRRAPPDGRVGVPAEVRELGDSTIVRAAVSQ